MILFIITSLRIKVSHLWLIKPIKSISSIGGANQFSFLLSGEGCQLEASLVALSAFLLLGLILLGPASFSFGSDG